MSQQSPHPDDRPAPHPEPMQAQPGPRPSSPWDWLAGPWGQIPGPIPQELHGLVETDRTVRRAMLALLVAAFVCLLVIGEADSDVLALDGAVVVPFAGISVSFATAAAMGSLLIFALSVYLHIFVGRAGEWADLPKRAREPFLFNQESVGARLATFTTFYVLPPFVVAAFAWKALPVPLSRSLVPLASMFVIAYLFLMIRRCPWKYRLVGVPAAAVAIILVGAVAGLDLGRRSACTTGLLASPDDAQGPSVSLPILRCEGQAPVFTRGVDLASANLAGAGGRAGVLVGADLTRATLSRAFLGRAHLAGATLDFAQLDEAELNRADLSGATMFRAVLLQATLDGADLTGTQISFTNLEQARLVGVMAEGARIEKSILPRANLTAANLAGASFRESRMRGVILQDASLENADLTGADLRGATLTNTRLAGADLTEAQLGGVRGLSCEELAVARNWRTAKGPFVEDCRAEIPDPDAQAAETPPANTAE